MIDLKEKFKEATEVLNAVNELDLKLVDYCSDAIDEAVNGILNNDKSKYIQYEWTEDYKEMSIAYFIGKDGKHALVYGAPDRDTQDVREMSANSAMFALDVLANKEYKILDMSDDLTKHIYG